MKQPYAALFRNHLQRLIAFLRKQYFRLLGLKIESSSLIGNISCNWPKNITIGAECAIEDGVRFRIAYPFSKENSIEIGNRVFIGECCQLNCVTNITIGDDTKIAATTTLVDVSHEVNPAIAINKQPTFGEKITIGKDVWIGAGCIILKGVTIGNGCIIGAGSLVNKSIPEYQIWAGVPAHFIRNRD